MTQTKQTTETRREVSCESLGHDECPVEHWQTVQGEAGGRTIMLAEWDAASTEQRTAWLKDGNILCPHDADKLSIRLQHNYCEPSPVAETRSGAECLTCAVPLGPGVKIRRSGWLVTPFLPRTEQEATVCRSLGHDVRPLAQDSDAAKVTR